MIIAPSALEQHNNSSTASTDYRSFRTHLNKAVDSSKNLYIRTNYLSQYTRKHVIDKKKNIVEIVTVKSHKRIQSSTATVEAEEMGQLFMKEERRKTSNLYLLRSFLDLEYNWNDNGADPFSHNLISYAQSLVLDLIRQPDVFPTARQSIQFEYENENNDYLEIEIFKDKMEIYIELNGFEDREFEIPLTDSNKLNKIVLDFYERNR